jgi:hypothetical protein
LFSDAADIDRAALPDAQHRMIAGGGSANSRTSPVSCRKKAKDHAPRLSQYRDDAIAERIEREAIRVARIVASLLPPSDMPRVLDKFVTHLWEEIALHRKHRRR